jgi:hypothetical protein
MVMKFLTRRCRVRPRGASRVDILVALACMVVACAVAVPVVGRTGRDSGEMRSLANLRTLAAAHEAYAQSFAGRQWTAIPDDAGIVNGNCYNYLTVVACPPQLLLGQGPNGAWWGLFLEGIGYCAPFGYQGSCANWTLYQPMTFIGSAIGSGSYRLPNATSFNSFVDGRFYSDSFFSPNDRNAYEISATYRDRGIAFESIAGEFAFSSYCLSPAAMYHPEVFAAANGGYRSPNSFAEGFASPSVAQCTYPDLKTRMIEYHWTLGAPSYRAPSPAKDRDSWIFNTSALASPNAIFFDGRVGRIANADAMADDAARQATEGIGLWSRTTPFGSSGFRGEANAIPSPEGITTSHTILTLDGILGRDLLSVR